MNEEDEVAMRDEIETLEAEIKRLRQQFTALGAAWRASWVDFDGRGLRDQIAHIFTGKNAGTEFYHDHVVEEYGKSFWTECAEFGCDKCAVALLQKEVYE